MSTQEPPLGRVCVIGSINLDTTYQVPALPRPGETILATGRSYSPGGKGANQAVAAATMGSEVRFIGAVGHDDGGDTGLRTLADRGIDTTGVRQVAELPTGTATVVVDRHAENFIVVDPAANGVLDATWVATALGDCSQEVVLAQLEVPVDALTVVARARPRIFVLNPAPVRDVEVLRPLLQHVDVLVPNRSELGQLVGSNPPTTLAEVSRCARDLAFDGKLVVTLGRDGAAVVDASGTIVEHVPAPAIEATDTSGAGDAFCGVLAHELARSGGDLSSAVHRAVELASTSTRHAGAQVPPSFGREAERTAR